MTKEYIPRETAIAACFDGFADCRDDCVSNIRRIPAADVVEVVRCKDCIYWCGENDPCKGICIDFDADGYCSEGKRKDGREDE